MIVSLPPWLTFPNYESYTVEMWIAFILAGTAGWLIRVYVSGKPIVAPSISSEGVKLNGLLDWFVSVVVAILADHNILFATIAGAGAPLIVEATLQWLSRLVAKAVPEETKP